MLGIVTGLTIGGMGIIKMYFTTEGKVNRARTKARKQIELLKLFGVISIYWLCLIAVSEKCSFTLLNIVGGIAIGLVVVWAVCMCSIVRRGE